MATVGKGLRARLETAAPHETFEINVFLQRDPVDSILDMDVGALSQEEMVQSLRGRGSASRRNLVSMFEERAAEAAVLDSNDPQNLPPRNVQSFWISNAVGVEVSRPMIEELLRRNDVLAIEINRHVAIEDLMDSPVDTAELTIPAPAPAAATPEPTWSVKRVGAPLLWTKGITGEGVVVAVIDSGVNYNHPDLQPNMWDGGTQFPHHGFDFASMDDDPRDDHGHGTACAGIVAGMGASGAATGVAPKARIMALRIGGEERNVWRALQFAIENKADVISMSITWKFDKNPDHPGWRRVCEDILAARIPHANSAGNQGSDLTGFPLPFNIGAPGNCPSPRRVAGSTGGLSSPITCGDTNDLDELVSGSGRGPSGWDDPPFSDYPFGNGAQPGLVKPDICAPGLGSISCNNLFPADPIAKPYREFRGTSAATPHVAGCLALLVHACKKAGTPVMPARLQEALEETAVRIASQTQKKENHFGSGRADVFAAFGYGRQRNWW